MFNRYLFILGVLLALLAACTPGGGEPISPDRPTPTAETSIVTPTTEIIANEANIDSVRLTSTSAVPVRMFATVSGNLPDGCVSLESTAASREDDAFTIHITTHRDPLALCTEALVPFSQQVELDITGLEPGYEYVVRAIGRDETAVSSTFTLPDPNAPGEGPAMSELPAACFAEVEPNGALINLQDGYCFQYPVQDGAAVHDVFPIGVAAIWGAPLTLSFEPVRAGLTVYKQTQAGGRSLDEIVAEIITNNPGAEVVETTTFAGEPAQVVEGIDGMMDSRRHYLLHNNFVYEITLVPLTPLQGFEEAVTTQRELLWQTANESFTWLPESIVEQFSFCPQGTQESSPYVNPRAEYCLLYPSYFRQQDITVPDVTIFTGPATDPTIPEPVQVTLQVRTETANGRSLPQIVDETISSITGLEIEQTEVMLGSEKAILVTGLPGRTAGRDLYTVHNDTLYHLRLDPLGFDQLVTDLELVWNTVLDSFTFFP